MNNKTWQRATLRIQPNSPGEGAVQTVEHLFGAVLKESPHAKRRKVNLWLLRSSLDALVPLPEQIEEILLFVRANHALFQDAERVFDAEIFCGFGSESGQGGFILPPHQLQTMAENGLSLSLDLYPPEPPEPNETA